MQRKGSYPPPPGASSILGLEAAGVVEQLGPEVTKWKKGDRVMALLSGEVYFCAHFIQRELDCDVFEDCVQDADSGFG